MLCFWKDTHLGRWKIHTKILLTVAYHTSVHSKTEGLFPIWHPVSYETLSLFHRDCSKRSVRCGRGLHDVTPLSSTESRSSPLPQNPINRNEAERRALHQGISSVLSHSCCSCCLLWLGAAGLGAVTRGEDVQSCGWDEETLQLPSFTHVGEHFITHFITHHLLTSFSVYQCLFMRIKSISFKNTLNK